MVKKVLILVLFFGVLISCSKNLIKDNVNNLEVKLENLEVWFDSMPKIESPSFLHFAIQYELKNLTSHLIVIDSIIYEIKINENQSIYLKENFDKEIQLNGKEVWKRKVQLKTNADLGIVKSSDKENPIFVNLFYKMNKKQYSEKKFLTKTEIQIVY